MCTCQTTLHPFPGAFAKLIRPVTRATIHARKGQLHVTVTTGDTTAAVSVPCTGTLPPAGVHAKGFADLVKPLREALSLKIEGETLQVESGPFRGSIPCTVVDVPPELPRHVVSAAVIGDGLASGLRRSLFSCGRGKRQHTLDGVLVTVKERLSLVSSDTHRLSITRVDAKILGSLDGIVPMVAGEVLMRLADKDHTQAHLACTRTHFIATAETWTLCTRLIDGQFPRYADVIPNLSEKSLRIEDKKGFLTALGTVSPCGRCDTVTIEIGDAVHLIGEYGRMPAPASAFGFETIKLNARYLKEMVQVCDDAHPMIRYSGADRPVRVDAPGWTHVLMPIFPPPAAAA